MIVYVCWHLSGVWIGLGLGRSDTICGRIGIDTASIRYVHKTVAIHSSYPR